METAEEKYKIISEMISRDNNLLNISWLCEIAGVSRSGYYSWVSRDNSDSEQNDKNDFDKILEVYKVRGYNKGARTIQMILSQRGIGMNLKKIRRLMRKYGLRCPIRKENPYRRMAKAIKTDNYAENLVNREFKKGPRKIILTDITYMFYGPTKQKAYLSVMKDSYTNEIVAYKLSDNMEMDFVLETLNDLMRNHGGELHSDTMIHSDQGVHYTSISFRELLKDNNLTQSMSRRGNCWDNAPQESFFGHMKDEIDITNTLTIEDLSSVIDDYMDYYNNARPQWKLAKLTPSQYYRYSVTGIYPIFGDQSPNPWGLTHLELPNGKV